MTKFSIPGAVLKQHIAILGKTGSGKTSTEKLAVEQVVAAGARVCVLDTVKSDWWGITSSASGKRAGLPFKILGGPRGHVPLHANAGKVIGHLVATGKLPLSIIDMADFEAGGVQRFFVDFAQSLFRHMRGVVYLVIEEAHEVAPKERAGFGAENLAIHWAKKLATGGRSKGIRLVVATQRVQSLHNAVLGSCETVIAHRLTTPADQEPVLKWMKANVDKEIQTQVAESLSSLPTGTGWLCSGEAKIFERVAFPKFKTYDNSKTPDGDAADVDITTAAVDQDELRSIIGDAVKEAEATDPKVLRKRLIESEKEKDRLRSELASKAMVAPDKGALKKIEQRAIAEAKKSSAPLIAALEAAMKFIIQINTKDFFKSGSEAMDQKAIEKAIGEATKQVTRLVETHLQGREKQLSALRTEAERLATRLKSMIEKSGEDVAINIDVRHNEQFTISAPSTPGTPRLVSAGNGTLERPQQLIVDAIRWWNVMGTPAPSHAQVAFVAGYSHKSGTWSTYLSRLRSAGIIGGRGDLVLTDAGMAAANEPAEQPTGDRLRATVLGKIDGSLQRILTPIIAAYPEGLSHQQAAEAAGYSHSSGTWSTYLSRLRSLDLIDGRGELRAQDWLFPS